MITGRSDVSRSRRNISMPSMRGILISSAELQTVIVNERGTKARIRRLNKRIRPPAKILRSVANPQHWFPVRRSRRCGTRRGDHGVDARHQLRFHVGCVSGGAGEIPVHAARPGRGVRYSGVLRSGLVFGCDCPCAKSAAPIPGRSTPRSGRNPAAITQVPISDLPSTPRAAFFS